MDDFSLEDPSAQSPLDSVLVGDVTLRPGDKVRLRPNRHGDVFDLALRKKVATIAAIEQDFEGRIHLAVVLDDDPGRDLGLQRQSGHRFFFAPDEVELMDFSDDQRSES